MKRALKIALFIVFVGAHAAAAQIGPRSCIDAYVSAKKSSATMGIAPSDVEETVARIASTIGLTRQVEIIPCKVDLKAFAVVIRANDPKLPEGEYLVYNNDWFESVGGKEISTPGVVVIAHELAHILNNDASSHRSRFQQELDADGFAGCAVARVNGDYKGLKDTLERLRPEIATTDYPDEKTSVQKSTELFQRCGGKLDMPVNLAAAGIPHDLIKYSGPSFDIRDADKLSKDWPSAKWFRSTSGAYRWAEYETTLFGRKGTIVFSLAADPTKLGRTEYKLVSLTQKQSHPQRAPEATGSLSDVKQLCGAEFQKIQSQLGLKLGGVKDRPVITTHNPPATTSFFKECKDLGAICYREDSTTTTDVFFNNSPLVRLSGALSHRYERDRHEAGWVGTLDLCVVSIFIDK